MLDPGHAQGEVGVLADGRRLPRAVDRAAGVARPLREERVEQQDGPIGDPAARGQERLDEADDGVVAGRLVAVGLGRRGGRAGIGAVGAGGRRRITVSAASPSKSPMPTTLPPARHSPR